MVMRFGQFLTSRGLVNEQQLSIAIREQIVRQRPLGRIAVEAGLMTMRQVMQVLAAQDGQEDSLRFGIMAVELGLLDETQLEGLLREQRFTRPQLGTILVEMEVLAEEQLARELDVFQELRQSEPGAEAAERSETDPGPRRGEPEPVS